MMTDKVTRRHALTRSGLLVGAAVIGTEWIDTPARAQQQSASTHERAFLYCLNTATIRGQKLGIVKEIEVASQAGYDAIEPWVDGLEEYVKGGGKLSDLGKRIADSGLTVEGAIGFPEWIVNDE